MSFLHAGRTVMREWKSMNQKREEKIKIKEKKKGKKREKKKRTVGDLLQRRDLGGSAGSDGVLRLFAILLGLGLTDPDIVRNADETTERNKLLVATIVSQDGVKLVFEVLAARRVEEDVVELEPSGPEHAGEGSNLAVVTVDLGANVAARNVEVGNT
jgi:hypothetical protein